MLMMLPIVVTLVGIVTVVSDVHPSKALEPNDKFGFSINTQNNDYKIVASMIIIPILVALAAKVMTQGVVVHRLQQPVPVMLLHITYSATSNDSNDNDKIIMMIMLKTITSAMIIMIVIIVLSYRTVLMM